MFRWTSCGRLWNSRGICWSQKHQFVIKWQHCKLTLSLCLFLYLSFLLWLSSSLFLCLLLNHFFVFLIPYLFLFSWALLVCPPLFYFISTTVSCLIGQKLVSSEIHSGDWIKIGTGSGFTYSIDVHVTILNNADATLELNLKWKDGESSYAIYANCFYACAFSLLFIPECGHNRLAVSTDLHRTLLRQLRELHGDGQWKNMSGNWFPQRWTQQQC